MILREGARAGGVGSARSWARRSRFSSAAAVTVPNTCSDRAAKERAVLVLGVDPGLTRCGLGVVSGSPGRTLELVAVDHIPTLATAPLGERLLAIANEVDAWLQRHEPDA